MQSSRPDDVPSADAATRGFYVEGAHRSRRCETVRKALPMGRMAVRRPGMGVRSLLTFTVRHCRRHARRLREWPPAAAGDRRGRLSRRQRERNVRCGRAGPRRRRRLESDRVVQRRWMARITCPGTRDRRRLRQRSRARASEPFWGAHRGAPTSPSRGRRRDGLRSSTRRTRIARRAWRGSSGSRSSRTETGVRPDHRRPRAGRAARRRDGGARLLRHLREDRRWFAMPVWSVPGNHENFGIERHLSLVSPHASALRKGHVSLTPRTELLLVHLRRRPFRRSRLRGYRRSLVLRPRRPGAARVAEGRPRAGAGRHAGRDVQSHSVRQCGGIDQWLPRRTAPAPSSDRRQAAIPPHGVEPRRRAVAHDAVAVDARARRPHPHARNDSLRLGVSTRFDQTAAIVGRAAARCRRPRA